VSIGETCDGWLMSIRLWRCGAVKVAVAVLPFCTDGVLRASVLMPPAVLFWCLLARLSG
jgi:hypothetical protein